jgi:hypothetical protein
MTVSENAGRGTFDLGSVAKAPFQDPQWVTKTLIVGVMMLIPIVGAWNALGWGRAFYLRRRSGEPGLPDANLSYIGSGAIIFFAVMLPFVPVAILMLLLSLLASAAGLDFVESMAGVLPQLAYFALVPAVVFLAIRDDDALAGFRFARLKQAITSKGLGTYALFALTLAACSVFADLGALAFCVGAFFTMPLAAALMGAAAHAFEQS